MDTSNAQGKSTQRVLSPAKKVKELGWIFAVLGVVFNAGTSISGFAESVREYQLSPYHFFSWWALVVEDVCLLVLLVTDKVGALGRAYVAVTGLFVYSTTQLQATAWVLTDIHNPVGVDGTTYAGFVILLVANLLLVTAMGMEHYIKPKWSNDEALPSTVGRETATEALVPVSDRRSGSVLVVTQKWLGLVVACFGVAGLVAALVANANQGCNFACVRNWWLFSAQLLGFILFIVTEVILKAPSFRPVLTLILAIQIRMLEWSVIGQPGDGSDSVQGVQKAGVIIAIVVSYLLLLSLCGRTTTDETPFGLRTLLWGALPAVAGLGVILRYKDLAFPDFIYSGEWQFTMYLLALIWIVASFVDKIPILLNFRLPLVAFIAITIQWDSVLHHAFNGDYMFFEETDWSWGPLVGYLSDETNSALRKSPIVIIASFLLVMIFMGITWKKSNELKSRPHGDLTSQTIVGNDLRGDEAQP